MALKEKRYLLPVERKGQCSKGYRCSFRHETHDRAQKPEHTAATPSEPTVSRGRGRQVSEAKVTMGPFRQPCRKHLKDICTQTSCEHWHPPECQFCKIEARCEAGDKCLFQHFKVDDRPNKKQKKSDMPKRRESDDKNAVMHSFLKVGLKPIRRVRFTKSTLRHASIREKKGPSLEKYKSNIFISKVPTR